MRWPWSLVLGLAAGFACAPRVDVRVEPVDVDAMTASMRLAQQTQVECRDAVAGLGDDVREPCAMVCTLERLLTPTMAEASRLLFADAGVEGVRRAPHRMRVTINDASVALYVAHLEGGFSCEKAE